MIRADEIRKVVREHYGARAAGGSCGCGAESAEGSACCGESRVGTIEGFVGPSLGCGTPLSYAELKPGETVVDLGSGAGREVLLAAREVGPEGRAIGIDMTAEMIATSRENARRSDFSNAEFRLGEIEHVPVSDGSVDAVISNCVINLVPDKTTAFAEAFRILKPGGRLIVSDMVTRGRLPNATRQDLTAWAGCIAGAADVDEYMATIERSGFHDTKILAQTEAAVGQVFSVTVLARKPVA
jgi:arsenite methyltransferase